MTKKFYIILCVLGILLSLGVVFHRTLLVWCEDAYFAIQFRFHNLWEPYLENNALTLTHPQPLSICFLTMETRGEKEEYVRLHNRNLEAYVKHRNQQDPKSRYEYLFETKCAPKRHHHAHNVYWCKFFFLREILEEGKYDYVVWLDSDTAITDFEVDFARVLHTYQSHWFAGLDKVNKYDLLNAGVVAVRNSKWGKKMIRAITETYNSDKFQRKCVSERKNKPSQLSGAWAQTCYEQGVMNRVLFERFREYVTVLPPKYIHNGMVCEGDFITHLYNSSSTARANCFRPFTPLPHETSS
jgi:hypothetical protein